MPNFHATLQRLFVLISAGLLLISVSNAMAQQDDKKAEALLNQFMQALASSADQDQAAKAALPYLHRTLLNPAGNDVSDDLRRFSFKKAHTARNAYAVPVKITRIHPTTQTQVGFKETAEAGSVIDYFLAKKDGVAGMPAPVKVFFPNNGGEPKVFYIGSL